MRTSSPSTISFSPFSSTMVLSPGHAHFLGQTGVQNQMTVFPVNRDEVLGLHQSQHDFLFFPAGMAGHVDLGDRLVQNLGALGGKDG